MVRKAVSTEELSLSDDQKEYVENGCDPNVRAFVEEASNLIANIRHLRQSTKEDNSDR